MKKTPLSFIIGACLLFCSCHKHNPGPAAALASVEVIYACNPPLRLSATSSLSVLDIAANGNFIVGMGGGIAPANVMDVNIPTGNEDLTFTMTSNAIDSAFAEWKLTATAKSRYDAFFGGPANNPCKLFMEDTYPTADSTKALVRFVNLSSDASSFDCVYNNTTITTGLSYQSVSPFFTVTPCSSVADSSVTLTLTNAASTSISVSLNHLDFVAGGIYTIILCGNYDSSAMGLTLYEYYNDRVVAL